MNSVPQIIDLFCGAGGFGLGFKQTGFRVVLGVDNDKAPARSYKHNFPESIVLAEDIKNITGKNIEIILREIGVDEADVVIGSPPCEPFTAANPRRKKNPLDRLYVDPIGRLVLHYIRLVGELKPKIFVMENVPGLLEKPIMNALRREFARVGYPQIYFNLLRAEDYCTPSHRLRVFVSNIRIKPERKCKRPPTVMDALKDLPPPGSDFPPNHQLYPIPHRKLKRIAKLKWGQPLIYYKGARKRLPNLIRLDPNRHAPTVLGSSRFIHPFENRFLTVREQARLMGYPDDHVFLGGREEQYNQVGESVPVPLAKAIAEEVFRKLRELT